MLGTLVSVQVDDHVLQASSLGRGPVDTVNSSGARNFGHVNDQVADLTEKDIGRFPSFLAGGLVLVTINKTNTGKAGCGLKNSRAVGVPNKLGKVVVNNWRRNCISTGGEVDNSRSDRGCGVG